MLLIDSHCHFDADAFDSDRALALQRAHAAGVTAQIVPAICAAGWPKLKQVCAQWNGLHPAYGLHPMYLSEHRPDHVSLLRTWVEREHPIAIGECGLDFFVSELDVATQQHCFEAQLKLARDFDLPVIVHARRSVDAVIAALRRFGPLRGVVHSFSGSSEQAAQLHKLGFLLGIGGPVTYERANRLRKLAATMPLEQLLLETDAPDQPSSTHRGQRNEPAYLPEIVATIAQLRGEDATKIAAETTANAQRLFRLQARSARPTDSAGIGQDTTL